MRHWYLPLVLLSVAACSRESMAPRTFGTAPPPPPNTAVAQSAPAAAKAAAVTGLPLPPPAGSAAVQPGPLPAATLSAPRKDPRWRDVDPAELAEAGQAAKAKDPALERFQDEQQRRDAQLMAQDAEEAAHQGHRGDERDGDQYRGNDRYARGDDRYASEDRYAGDERYGDYRYADGDPRYAARRASRERERAQAYGDDRDARGDDRYYAQDPYPNEYPPEAEGYDDGGYEQGPPPDEDYDPYRR
jgi:hypothetical protein